jgi:hypothetical protein
MARMSFDNIFLIFALLVHFLVSTLGLQFIASPPHFDLLPPSRAAFSQS